nr:MAG TPA: hypothetical protein [Caudoviricetes sp.]
MCYISSGKLEFSGYNPTFVICCIYGIKAKCLYNIIVMLRIKWKDIRASLKIYTNIDFRE